MTMIAIPTNRSVTDVRLTNWLYGILEEPKGTKPALMIRHKQPVDANRNEIVKTFLSTKHEWLLFLDDDMIPKFDLDKMIGHGKKIVSALTVVMQKGVPTPLIMKRVAERKEVLFRTLTVEDLGNDSGSLVNVDGVGTGCLLIHREVLEKMKPPWFKFKYTRKGLAVLSEDYYFSEKARALGYDLFVDTRAICGHAKYVDLYELNKIMYKIASAGRIKVEHIGEESKIETFSKDVKPDD